MIQTSKTDLNSTNLVNNKAISSELTNGPAEVIKYLHNRNFFLSTIYQHIMYLHATANMTLEVVKYMHAGPPLLTIVVLY